MRVNISLRRSPVQSSFKIQDSSSALPALPTLASPFVISLALNIFSEARHSLQHYGGSTQEDVQ
jgi:hypothetical protein